ncbi:pyrophosphatase PpaX, partial [Salmonella enterica]|nr:pyrophosphatase PpaX [Salmonella enterica]
MIDTVLFDLDGTIIDTNELIINSFLHVMEDLQVSTPWTREQIIPHMGGT